MDSSKKESGKSAILSGPGSKLRYPLRSSIKLKDEGLATKAQIPSSASRSDLRVSSISRSIILQEISGKEKSLDQPLRKPWITGKSAANSLAVRSVIGSISRIPGNRRSRLGNINAKGDKPVSNASRSIIRRKFFVLSSASYWLSQIKLSESAVKHHISLGFFKLALQCECEPLQKVSDELKSYAVRHHLLDLGEPAKKVLRKYNLLEEVERLELYETSSMVLTDGKNSCSEVKTGRHEHSRRVTTNSRKASSSAEQAIDMKKDATKGRKNASLRRVSVGRSLGSDSISVTKSIKTSNSGIQQESGDKKKKSSVQKENKNGKQWNYGQ